MFRYQEGYASTLPDLLNGSACREALLKILAESVSLNPQQSTPLSKLGSVIGTDNLKLLPREPTVYTYHTPRTIWKWMSLYRTEGHHLVPTFMFPGIMAGPDLVFILESQPAVGKEEEEPRGTLQQPFIPSEKIMVAEQVCFDLPVSRLSENKVLLTHPRPKLVEVPSLRLPWKH